MNNIIKTTLLLLPLTAITSFTAQAQNTKYQRNGGVWFEVRDDKSNPCRYTEDNKIYQSDREFTFEFHYFDPQGKERYVRYERIPIQRQELTEAGDTVTNTYYLPDFSFSDVFDVTDSCVNRYLVRVLCTCAGFDHNYNQTVEEFNFIIADTEQPLSWSGIVENERNLWLHPIRDCLFKILEFNPFPYIQYPIKKGKTWKWLNTFGSHWGDERWKTWTGTIVNKYKYKITDTDCEVVTPMGTLSCVKVEAVAKSRIGKTRLTAYYNDTYGFVKMDNTNIDGSRIEIMLVGITF